MKYIKLFEWFLSQNNNKIKGYTNVIYSGITTNRMAQFILDIINLFLDILYILAESGGN